MTLGGIIAGLLVAVASGWVARATVLDQRDLISVVADPVFNTQPSVVHKVRFDVGDQCHT